jgi:hypothetical protein
MTRRWDGKIRRRRHDGGGEEKIKGSHLHRNFDS